MIDHNSFQTYITFYVGNVTYHCKTLGGAKLAFALLSEDERNNAISEAPGVAKALKSEVCNGAIRNGIEDYTRFLDDIIIE